MREADKCLVSFSFKRVYPFLFKPVMDARTDSIPLELVPAVTFGGNLAQALAKAADMVRMEERFGQLSPLGAVR